MSEQTRIQVEKSLYEKKSPRSIRAVAMKMHFRFVGRLALLPCIWAYAPPLQPKTAAAARHSPPVAVYAVDVPYKEAAYSPEKADAFFRQRPIESLRRLAQLTQLSGGFVASTLLDKRLGREEEMVDQRSDELLELVTKLGPTFIKIGQALSIRTDLLPAPWVKGLTQLQDNVEPFSAAQGRSIIEDELGIRLDDTFSTISLDPVASASIGQVYKATLKATGEEVAVKVQRPQVLYDVALDLFMLRTLAPTIQRLGDFNTDLVALVDAWGYGFVNELDYNKEAEATTAFSKAMDRRGLGSVTSPEVVPSLSSTHVLTTKWVDGERLASSDATDVPRLCGVALNAYLTMLLDTGCLHCDPHPGNLLRTPDGKLCILDFGMTLDVPSDLQLSLLEFIANLNAENYESVPDDLVNLGFVPAEKIEELRQSGLTVAISRMLKLAADGGGASGMMNRMVEQNKERYGKELMAEFGTLESPEAVKERQRRFREDWKKEMAEDALARGGDMTMGGGGAPVSTAADLTAKIEQMQSDNSNVFAIPEYFVYMSRAFSTLEGIGLSADPNYAIIGECFPYIAKRLISDDSPRARGALRTLLYGTSGELNLSKLKEVTQGLESYTVSTSSVASSKGESSDGRNQAIEQMASAVFAEEGSYVQSLLLKEAAALVDSGVRNAVTQAASNRPQLFPFPTPPFPFPTPPNVPLPLAPLLAPITLPLELGRAALSLAEIDQRDKQRLENIQILTDLASGLTGGGRGGGGGGSAPSAPPGTLGALGAARAAVASDGAGSSSMVPSAGGAPAPAPSAEEVSKQAERLRSVIEGAIARRAALARTGVRFGGELAAVQAERLREREADAQLSELATRLAAAGAVGLEGAARSLALLDKGLAAGPTYEGDAQPPQ